MTTILFLLALSFFSIASCIDWPWRQCITKEQRLYGNFCCSIGFVFLTAALFLKG